MSNTSKIEQPDPAASFTADCYPGRQGLGEVDVKAPRVGNKMKLEIVPIKFDEANLFVKRHHRHHKPMSGCKFCVAVADGNEIRGVAIVGRPVARGLDDGWTLEVNRCCVLENTPNACSMLYAAAWRVAREMGYRKVVTYTLPEEGGASLRGVGWKLIGSRGGGSWNCKSRPRVDKHPLQQKLFWEVT